MNLMRHRLRGVLDCFSAGQINLEIRKLSNNNR